MPLVLLVEDEPLIADLIQTALEDKDLTVVVAHSSSVALTRLEANFTEIAVLVTDINLGDRVTGFDVAKRARTLNPDVKVVYVTGLPSNIYAAEESALMFPKPFDIAELADQVHLLATTLRGRPFQR
jgi:DNA-binding response OmpR family regulator